MRFYSHQLTLSRAIGAQMAKSNGKGKQPKPLFTTAEAKLLKPILEQRPPIRELPVSELQIDYAYQDRPRERIVNQISDHFSEALLGVLIVGQRPDKSFWICDGASRVLAILRRGENQRVMRCLIFQTQGQQQEALLFAWSNSKRSKEPTKLITNLQAYGVAGTDQGFSKAIEECGFSLSAKGKRALHGPSYVRTAWELDGDGTAMRKALFSIKDGWRDKFQIHGYMVLGIARLYYYTRKSIDEQVRRILHRTTPDEIMDKVSRRYASSGAKSPRIHPDDKPRLVTRILADMINRNPGKAGKIDVVKLDESRVGA